MKKTEVITLVRQLIRFALEERRKWIETRSIPVRYPTSCMAEGRYHAFVLAAWFAAMPLRRR
jgi:hypothetical protein